ncbi:DUF1120 domain-containing protein [Pseudomonas frederiksbergensis]|nr:DUF1120 domain-containing protein [Pseudomonas frederiksbergensis]
MNKQLSFLATALLISHMSSGFAASTTELTVTGMITPSACSPILSAGGVVDYGKISAKDLMPTNAPNPVNESLLGNYSPQLSVACDASTPFSLRVSDDR